MDREGEIERDRGGEREKDRQTDRHTEHKDKQTVGDRDIENQERQKQNK